jgi:tetratricopeptide (TPR) repeat protein
VRPHSISLYELSHKPLKRARRLLDEGTAELKLRHYPASVRLFQKALLVDPDYWEAENNLGFAFLQLQQPTKAEPAFARATEIDPMNAIAYVNLCVAALQRNDYLLAEKSGTEAVRLNPQLAEGKAMLGLALVSQGKWTATARKLLEETRSIPASATILKKWPKPNAAGPTVTVITLGLR